VLFTWPIRKRKTISTFTFNITKSKHLFTHQSALPDHHAKHKAHLTSPHLTSTSSILDFVNAPTATRGDPPSAHDSNLILLLRRSARRGHTIALRSADISCKMQIEFTEKQGSPVGEVDGMFLAHPISTHDEVMLRARHHEIKDSSKSSSLWRMSSISLLRSDGSVTSRCRCEKLIHHS